MSYQQLLSSENFIFYTQKFIFILNMHNIQNCVSGKSSNFGIDSEAILHFKFRSIANL